MSPKVKMFVIAVVILIVAFGLAYRFRGELGSGNLAGLNSENSICRESDGGFNLNKRGTASIQGESKVYEDRCDDSTYIIEYMCAKDAVREVPSRCPVGTLCTDGRCAK